MERLHIENTNVQTALLLCSKIGRNCKKQEGTISALWNKKRL